MSRTVGCQMLASTTHWSFTLTDIFKRQNLFFYFIYNIVYNLESKYDILVYTEHGPWHRQWFWVVACLPKPKGGYIQQEQALIALHNAGKNLRHALWVWCLWPLIAVE